MERDNEIHIYLEDSVNTKAFNEDNLVHKVEYRKVTGLIEDNLDKAIELPDKKNEHNTITVLGTRGSGKTSFLLSIEEKYREHDDIKVLERIDPTLIEEKGHVFLNVISIISNLVEDKISSLPANDKPDSLFEEWQAKLEKLANGLPSIDGVGVNNMDHWQDAEFVMENGIKAVTAARNLERNFTNLLDSALRILGKKAFLVIFDDIDVDASKGLAVLETIRKYFTSNKLITILSGDLRLYTMLIRQKKWENFGDEILKYEALKLKQISYFNDTVTDLTGQYLLKIMQPQFRIHLNTLLEKKNIDGDLRIFVNHAREMAAENENSRLEIGVAYNVFLREFGIINETQREVYKTFLLSLPLRSQIQLLLAASRRSESFNDKVSDIFQADLLEKRIDVNLAKNSAKYLNIIILKLLITEKRLNDLYQLQPVGTDNSLNVALFTLNILQSNYIKNTNRFLIFDYLIRVGYLRNLVGLLSVGSDNDAMMRAIEDICVKAGLFNDNVLRDATGHILGYLYGDWEKQSTEIRAVTSSFTRLMGLKGNARRPLENRIDSVFNDANVANLVMGYIPCFVGEYSYKNESRVAYSIYMLISAIGEIVKRFEIVFVKENEETNDIVRSIRNTLIELSQIKSYPIPQFTLNKLDEIHHTTVQEEVFDDDGGDDRLDESIQELAEQLYQWLNDKNYLIKISPHLLGKIATRFFYAMNNIGKVTTRRNLGDLFQSQVQAFLNAVLIEDVKENIPESSFLNLNNVKLSNKILLDNLRKIARNKVPTAQLAFSRWMLKCPLLTCYLNRNDHSLINQLDIFTHENRPFDIHVSNIYEMLNQVDIYRR